MVFLFMYKTYNRILFRFYHNILQLIFPVWPLDTKLVLATTWVWMAVNLCIIVKVPYEWICLPWLLRLGYPWLRQHIIFFWISRILDVVWWVNNGFVSPCYLHNHLRGKELKWWESKQYQAKQFEEINDPFVYNIFYFCLRIWFKAHMIYK